MHRSKVRFVLGVAFWALGLVDCDSSTDPDTFQTIIEPIEIDDVEVIISRASQQVSLHVTGRVGDSCSTLRPAEQQREGNGITVSITRTRVLGGICLEFLQLYDERIPLEGDFPRGTYIVTVNNVERSFSIP